MKNKRRDNELHPGITMHKIPVKAGFAGLLFTISVMLACLIGIPAIISFFVAAILLGIGVAVMLRFIPGRAGLVILVLTGVMIACLAIIPSVRGWRQKQSLDLTDLRPIPIAPPPEAALGSLSAPCDYRQSTSKPPSHSIRQRAPQRAPALRVMGRERHLEDPTGSVCCTRTTRSQPQAEAKAAQSALDGTWEAQMNGLPGVTLIVADAGGGQIGGVATFYFQLRGDDGKWRVAGEDMAPLLVAHAKGKTLMFQIQGHKTHDSPEFGPDVKFRMELTANHEALLYNLSEPSVGPSKLTRQPERASCEDCI
jgi:hypothetical protein